MGVVDGAYGAWAARYTALFGGADRTDARDLALVRRLAALAPGPVLDAGCGPGQLTAVLHDAGARASGLDLTPAFVGIARAAHPGLRFEVGDLTRLPRGDGSLGGVLAWYSLIHLPPEDLRTAVGECRRVLAPGGVLLVGCFDAAAPSPFPHRVAPAWRRPVAGLAALLEAEGFAVVERHRRTDPGRRPHGALLARRA